MSSANATLQQRAAIEAKGNVLLVAGAGTGKTTTLVYRCLRLVLEERVAIDRILMVTFTEAAAAEMRHRIRDALQEQIAAAPDDLRLAEQLALLDTSFISTLHAFCLRLVREHFHELQVDPQLTVLDEQQTRPLAQEVLEELFQRAYADTSARGEQVRELIERYGRGDDKGIRKLVWQLHVFMQSLAQPHAWLADTLAFYAGEQPDLWQDALLTGAADWANEWQGIVAETARDAANLSPIRGALDSFLTAPSLERLSQALGTVAEADEVWKHGTKKFRKPLDSFFNDADFLRSLLPKDGHDPIASDWQQVRGMMRALLELTQEFTECYRTAKRDMGGVDFADLEQLSLQLLLDANGQPTATARTWQQRFDHIFVDECQDINAAQDAIIRSVSRSGAEANRFMVGDVKQSIYRFRLANPHIFQGYEHEWKMAGEHHQVLPLTENFRSREGVIDTVNTLFSFLMRPALGGLHYDADAALQFGAREARTSFSRAGNENTPTTGIWPEPAVRTELHLVVAEKDTEAEADDDWADLLTMEREARIVAKRLRELHTGQHQIWDKETKEFRPVRWSDMAILMRSAAGKAEAFVRACHEAGVPLLAERAGFFTAIEVLDLVNLLRLLDNPLQDIPLLAVLRSPLVGLSLDELALIRATRKHDCCWLALHQWHREHRDNPETLDTWRIVDEFFQHHTSWRALIRQTSLSVCLDRVLGETHYEAYLLTMDRGEERVANVKRLLDLARRYDPYQRQGLFRFLQFIDAQEEVEQDMEPASPRHPDAVQFMTIHRSKGLEFPVVVVANIDGRFNTRVKEDDILRDEQMGIAPRVVLPDSDQRYPTIAHWVVKRREQRETMNEEVRLRYVALTRARDTLILTGTGSTKLLEDRWGERSGVSAQVEFEAKRASSFYAWLKLWLRETTTHEHWQGDYQGGTDLIRWQLHTGVEVEETSESSPEPASTEATESTFAEDLAERLTWTYAYPAATVETAKTSVTVLRRRRDETDDEAKPLVQTQFQFQFPAPKREAGSRLSGADVGKAHHTFLQFVELTEAGSLTGVQAEVQRLTEIGVLSEEEAAALSIKSLAEFWSSKIGQSICAQVESVQREMPFTARFSASDLIRCGVAGVSPSLPAEEFVIVQGTIDLAVIQTEEIWLLDFKSDRVKPDEMASKLAVYEPQLKLYALALERIYQRPVKHRWLHWLHLGKTVEV